MVELVRHRQTKEAATDMLYLQSPRHISTLPRLCENFNVRRARRSIFEKLRDMRTDNAADIRLNAMLGNCIFYISPMYEFSHSLGQKLTNRRGLKSTVVRFSPKADKLLRRSECSDVPCVDGSELARTFFTFAA